MTYQQSQSKDDLEKIPVRNINGQPYIPLKYVNDRLTKIEQQNVQILENSQKTLQNTEILKKKCDAILRQTFELAEFTVPRLFIVLPESTPCYNPAHWFHLKYRLYFLCECENDDERHFAFHEGYEIKQPREFFRKYGRYLHNMLTFLKFAISIGSLVVPQLSPIATGISNFTIPNDRNFWNNLSTQIARLDEILVEVGKTPNISTEENDQYVEGAELRRLESFLKKNDDHRKFGNLYRSVTKNGHVRWVCIQHYKKHYSQNAIKSLREQFQKCGGEMKGDTAIMQREASNKFSEMLNVLRSGLPVFSIILKNLNVKEENFNKLLTYVSQQSAIHNLRLENITVLSYSFNIKKPIIISKLDEIVRANDKLNIQYSYTESLSKFDSKVIDVIKKTNSRLTFQLRSREDTPTLELAGTNENGFILSINNSDEKNNIRYHIAISNIFSTKPNVTKILLHNGVMSESIWISFYQFLTTSQTLEELTIDCRLTLVQTKELSSSLSGNRTLKTLHMFNVWERENELNGCKDIFEMLHKNDTLIEFTLICHTDQLQLDFVATSLLQNKFLQVLRLPKCQIHQNTDVQVVENFLQTTSIHTLSLDSIVSDREASLERLAHAVDRNETLEILELKGSDCSAIFHRKRQLPGSDNKVVCSSPARIISSIDPSRSKFKRFLDLFSCYKGEHHHHSHEEIISPPVVPAQKDKRKSVTTEPFYALCNHPSFYKQIQEITQNLNLEELQVTIGAEIEMKDIVLSMKSNLTVTRLRISRRTLSENDIHMLFEAFRDNTTITHLNLNETKISITDFRQIFSALRDDRTLRVLEVNHCISQSDRDLFTQEIKTLELKNPFLKVVYENS